MMLRKRSRSQQKDQNMGHLISDSSESYSNSDAFLKQKHKINSLFTVPGLFVGLNPKVSESDSVRSPTSPLDFRVFSKSTLGNPFRATKPFNEGNQKSWDYNKVGLSIIDSLEDETKQSGKVLRSSASKNILFGPQMRVKNPSLRAPFDSLEVTNSLPKNYAIFPYTHVKPSNSQMINSNVTFGIGETPLENEPFGKFWSYSLDSASCGSHLTGLTNRRTKLSPVNSCLPNEQNPPVISPNHFVGSGKDFVGSLSASEIELSEDYTCVRTHGPNPKTTHIYGDCILECHNDEFTNSSKNEEQEAVLRVPPSYPSDDFLSFCYSCRKKLEGEDIYMYRGEKAFCSWNCRSEEILIEEEMEKTNNDSSSGDNTLKSNSCEELFETSSMFIAST